MNMWNNKTARSFISDGIVPNLFTLCVVQTFATPNEAKRFL